LKPPIRSGVSGAISSLDRQRLDKWLWHARVVRSRTGAAALVESGHVRVNGERTRSASRVVRIGDVLTVALNHSVRVLKVAGFAERRVSAVEARDLVVDLTEGGAVRPRDESPTGGGGGDA
jgi:ribosome-associated heat shock protein Hsp15